MEMKKQFFVLILFLCSVQAFSQFQVFSEYFPYNKKTDVHPVISNPEMGLPLIFISGRDVRIYYLGDEYKFQREILIKRSVKDIQEYLGSYIVDSSLVITFSNKKMNLVSQLLVNLNNGSFSESPVSSITNNQKYLASWEVLDSLFVLSVANNSNTLFVRKFYGDGDVCLYEFNLDSNFVDVSKVSNLPTSFDIHSEKLQKIDSSIPVSLQTASANNKVYLLKDKIIITLDRDGHITYLIALNLYDNSYHISDYPLNISQQYEDVETNCNSFIYENTIFQLSINKYEFRLKIESLDDSTKMVSYKALRGKYIDFSNSPLSLRNEKEGFLFGDPVITDIRSTRRFLKMVSNMKPAISVFNKYPNFQILLGGVMDIHQAAGVTSNTVVSSGGDMLVSPNGGLAMPDPDYNFPTNYSFTSYSSRLTAYFSSNIDTSSFAHSDKSISKYTYDYIIEYANYMSGRFGLVTIFKMKGDYYLGYYSYSNQTYNIEWFKNIDDYSVQY